jgi:serine/threonine-protein kinase
MLGEKVGSYEVVEALGSGGMGAIFVAEHVLLGKRAAVKVLKPEVSVRKESVARFFNEAKSAALIRHPGIVDIYDFGFDASGGAFIIMELLEGWSLKDMIRQRGTLGEERIARIGWEIAESLEAAHAKGIVHRDLKPSNVFLVRDPAASGGERVKVLDFGVAKLTGPMLEASVDTQSDALIGTPLYMAPEQARGAGEVDARADIYALGCMLFEMACGRPPFVMQGLGEILSAHMHTPAPRAREVGATIEEPLDRLIARMLAKAPGDRPQTMGEVARALAGLAGDEVIAEQAQAKVAALAETMTLSPAESGPVVAGRETTLGGAGSEMRSRGTDPARRRPVGVMLVGAGVLAAGSIALFMGTRAGTSSETTATADAGLERAAAPVPTRTPPTHADAGTTAPPPAPPIDAAAPAAPPPARRTNRRKPAAKQPANDRDPAADGTLNPFGP